MVFTRYSLVFVLVLLVTVGCISIEHESDAFKTEATKKPKLRFEAEKSVGAWVEMWNTYDLSEVDRLFLTNDKITYFLRKKKV